MHELNKNEQLILELPTIINGSDVIKSDFHCNFHSLIYLVLQECAG